MCIRDRAKTLVEELHRGYAPKYGSDTEHDKNDTIKTVGVFVNETVDNLITIANEANLDAVQLHGDEDEAFIQSLKERTNVEVWKAIQIRSAADVEAVSYTHLY